jgi:hypothetical protein
MQDMPLAWRNHKPADHSLPVLGNCEVHSSSVPEDVAIEADQGCGERFQCDNKLEAFVLRNVQSPL